FNLAKIKESANGYEVQGYVPLRDKLRGFHHELGHYIDDALGELGSADTGSRFTDTDNSLAALQADFEALKEKGLSEAELERFEYFLPEHYRGTALHGKKDHWQDTRKEIFAELWTEIQGHDVYGLARHF